LSGENGEDGEEDDIGVQPMKSGTAYEKHDVSNRKVALCYLTYFNRESP